MSDVNIIKNEDCLITMNNLEPSSVDLVITSPPYNFSKKRKGGPSDKGKYDTYKDNIPEEDYIDWTIKIFNGYDKIVNENRVVLYNFSYSIENPSLPYKLAAKIIENTNWEIVDTILWKKNTSMPHPASYNRLNRIYEDDSNLEEEEKNLKKQLQRSVEYLQSLPVNMLSLDSVEADDTIAYCATSYFKDWNVVIMSADKDSSSSNRSLSQIQITFCVHERLFFIFSMVHLQF